MAGKSSTRVDKRRSVQCKACPWKKSVVPDRDIPGGYEVEKHRALDGTIAGPDPLADLQAPEIRIMACHESQREAPYECVGWVLNQLGDGNNIRLRIAALDGRYADFRTVGPQHERFEDTLPQCPVTAADNRGTGEIDT